LPGYDVTVVPSVKKSTYFVPMMCTSLRPAGGVCAGDAEGGFDAVASSVVVVESELAVAVVSFELEVEFVVVISEGVETVLVELSVTGVEEASTNAKAGRTTNIPNTASTAKPAVALENVTL
jgi:hypothetical protein